jgi:hypothetical protein
MIVGARKKRGNGIKIENVTRRSEMPAFVVFHGIATLGFL